MKLDTLHPNVETKPLVQGVHQLITHILSVNLPLNVAAVALRTIQVMQTMHLTPCVLPIGFPMTDLYAFIINLSYSH